jgi:hypothetical protein
MRSSARIVSLLSMLIVWLWLSPAPPAHAVEVVQIFPVNLPGTFPQDPQTGWRIRYQVLPGGTHGYGLAQAWEIQSVEFMRGFTETGQPDWIKILNNLAFAEMYVPYYDGLESWDMAEFNSFVPASPDFIPSAGVISAAVQPDGVVIAEVVDDSVRWMSPSNQVRRGQRLDLWATLDAANYRYVIRYSFLDDGSIRVRVAGTAQNLRSLPVGTEAGMHVHQAAWRMEFDLGAANANAVHVVERIGDPTSAAATLQHRPFNNGLEGGEVWNSERLTSLMVESTVIDDRHSPPSKIGYKMLPVGAASLRTFRPYTQKDVWIARRTGPNGSTDRLKYIDVPTYVALARPLDGQALAIWATAAVHHVPRTEDFGPIDYDASQGLAITMWTGFDLMPHNLWDKTPLYSP